jgi:hypothetical protein
MTTQHEMEEAYAAQQEVIDILRKNGDTALVTRLQPIFDSAVLQVIESARQFAPRRQRGTTRSGAAISLR